MLATTEGGLLPDHQQFGLDLAFLIRRLEIEGESPASPFYARIAGLSCVMGHSMGGGASFLAAASDPEIDAIANLAAAETNPSAIAAGQGLTIPALLFSGSVDCVTPPLQHQIPMYNALASECKFLLTITGASHCQFAEYNFACNLGEFACDDPTVSRAAQQQTVLDFVLPWLQFVLGEQPAAFCSFRDAVSTDPRITYLAYCSEIPAAPQLTIVPVTSGVELRWNAVPYACSYTLQRSITGAEEDFINYWIGSANEYTDLTNELLVFYRLRANNQ